MIESGSALNRLLRFALILLLISCIFDPANKVLGLKMHLFIASWIIFLAKVILVDRHLNVSSNLFIYLLIFVLIVPFISLFYYAVTNGDFSRFDGFLYLKTYLFLGVVIILYHSRIDLMKPAIVVLTVLSVITFVLYIIGHFDSSFLNMLESKIGGKRYDLARLGQRDIFGLKFNMVYFETSPLIVFPIGYFSWRLIRSAGIRRIGIILLLGINVAAMFVGATRNNMIASLVTPLAVIYWYTRRKILFILIAISLLLVIVGTNFNELKRMVDARETSNKIKITFYNEYRNILRNADVLLFGQGMGSYFDSPRGLVSNSELTYLEIVRRFGIVLSIFIFGLLLYPFRKLMLSSYKDFHYIYIAYAMYLLMCFTNPLLLSSTGMLLLAFVLYVTFIEDSGTDNKLKTSGA